MRFFPSPWPCKPGRECCAKTLGDPSFRAAVAAVGKHNVTDAEVAELNSTQIGKATGSVFWSPLRHIISWLFKSV